MSSGVKDVCGVMKAVCASFECANFKIMMYTEEVIFVNLLVNSYR